MNELDPRIAALNEWQRRAYQLMWTAATRSDRISPGELDRMAAERPKEFAAAAEVWEEIMLEVCY